MIAGDPPGHAQQVQVCQRDRPDPPQRAQEPHCRGQAQQEDLILILTNQISYNC